MRIIILLYCGGQNIREARRLARFYSMKAAVLYANEDIRYSDWPEPEVAPGTVKIAVRAAGICGSDVPRVLDHAAHYYPIVLGHEFSGVVTETGEGVTKVAPGDHVSGVPLKPCMKCPDCARGNFSQCKHYSFIGSREQGAFAEYIVIPETNAVKLEPEISFEQGALFEPSSVCLHAMRCAGYAGGGNVAVLGCGTIGIFTMQWAKIFGSRTVTSFATSRKSLELASRMGADYTINTKDEDFYEKAMEITGGAGFDYVFESAGSNMTHVLALKLAGNHAHVCYVGTPKSPLTFTVPEWENLNRKELKVTGSWMSGGAPYPGSDWELTGRCFADGRLKYDPALFHAVYPLSDCEKAFRE